MPQLPAVVDIDRCLSGETQRMDVTNRTKNAAVVSVIRRSCTTARLITMASAIDARNCVSGCREKAGHRHHAHLVAAQAIAHAREPVVFVALAVIGPDGPL